MSENGNTSTGDNGNTGGTTDGDGKPATGATDDTGKPLGPNGEKALESERAARKAAEAEIAKYKQAEQDAEREKLGESERLTLERDEHKTKAATAEATALRYEIALDKGLTKTLAKRLVGATRAELEADADELLEQLGGKKSGDGKPPSSKAREVLPTGGHDPDDEPDETDPAKLAAKIRRH